MDNFKDKSLSFKGVLEQFESEKGPFFGSKELSPLFPNLLTKWSQVAISTVVVLISFVFAYQIVVFFLPNKSLNSTQQTLTQTTPELNTEALKPFLNYVANFKKREIFKIYQTPGKKVVPVIPQMTIQQATANLVLSGIIFEEEPQAIIEDKQKKKTYILKKGDYLENIKIEEINRGKIRLRLGSQTTDLKL